MLKKTVFTLILCAAMLPLTPSEGFSWPHHRHYPSHHYRHHYIHDDALAWGVAGLVVGSLVTASIAQPRVYTTPPPNVIYVQPPPRTVVYSNVSGTGQIFNYPPEVPPGMCRWERPMLDAYGNPVLTRHGVPAKVYTLGSCSYPPQY